MYCTRCNKIKVVGVTVDLTDDPQEEMCMDCWNKEGCDEYTREFKKGK